MTRLVLTAWLVTVWVALWGRLTIANVASGVIVAVALLVALPLPSHERAGYVLRPLAAGRLTVYFIVSLVRANLALTAAILSPRPRVRTGVVAVPLLGCSEGLQTFVANVTALMPGTMTVEVTMDPPTFYVHVLQLDDPETVRREVRTLEALAIRAFGSADAVRRLQEVTAP